MLYVLWKKKKKKIQAINLNETEKIIIVPLYKTLIKYSWLEQTNWKILSPK